ncbi:hypothetical protein [Streptomyces sp. R41]|uniref:Uncharacterized protein n=1 Tax=Streptomyces sp. R41 TaxID=3238632 RepID=A0AB39RTH1_9ACTN
MRIDVTVVVRALNRSREPSSATAVKAPAVTGREPHQNRVPLNAAPVKPTVPPLNVARPKWNDKDEH